MVTPLWEYYLSLPFTLLLLLAASWFGSLVPAGERSPRILFLTVALLSLVLGAAGILKNVPQAIHPAQWSPLAVHKTALEVRHILDKYPPFPPLLKALLAKQHGFPRWPVRPPLEEVPPGIVEKVAEEFVRSSG